MELNTTLGHLSEAMRELGESIANQMTMALNDLAAALNRQNKVQWCYGCGRTSGEYVVIGFLCPFCHVR